jgi:thiamine pyrophosphate-dependent acetolactate synthase large subunit-like protein
MAREKTDIVVVLLKNDAYAILGLEMARVRENELNARMKSMLNLGSPTLDWVKIATGPGVPATRATTAEEFHRQFEGALGAKGPAFDRVPDRHAERVARARRCRSPKPLRYLLVGPVPDLATIRSSLMSFRRLRTCFSF